MERLPRTAAAWVALAVLMSGGASPSVRQLPDLDLAVFSCAPNPTHWFIASSDALEKTFSELARHCPADLFEQRRRAFRRSIARARLDWSKEVLVIAQDWYGTGMAKPGLVFSRPVEDVLDATISWRVPPPPVTPDTATCRFAFAVRRSAIKRIRVTGQNSGSGTFVVSR